MHKKSSEILRELYSKEYRFMIAGEKTKVPKSGTLGLLASGYRGLIAWRKAKGITFEQIEKQKNEKK